MMSRRRLLIVVGVIVVAIVLLLGAILSPPQFLKRPTLILPEAGEVAEMRASLRKLDSDREEVPEFVVPTEHVPRILRWLRPTEYDPRQRDGPHLDELGSIRIWSKSGDEVSIRFYSFGVNPAVLTANGADYFGGPLESWLEAREPLTDGGPDGGYRIRREVEEAFKASRQTN
jgi:hypothetical protein